MVNNTVFNTVTKELSITYEQILVSKVKGLGRMEAEKTTNTFLKLLKYLINFFITLTFSSSDPAVEADSTAAFALPRWHIMSSKQNIGGSRGCPIISPYETAICKLRFCHYKEKLLCISYSLHQIFLSIPFNNMLFGL